MKNFYNPWTVNGIDVIHVVAVSSSSVTKIRNYLFDKFKFYSFRIDFIALFEEMGVTDCSHFVLLCEAKRCTLLRMLNYLFRVKFTDRRQF